jgi:hypothetical protein
VPEIAWVTWAQIDAARLAVELAIEDGEEPDPLMVKIAEATPMRRPHAARDDPGGTAAAAS